MLRRSRCCRKWIECPRPGKIFPTPFLVISNLYKTVSVLCWWLSGARRKYGMQTWSRCDSKTCFISAKDLPVSTSEGLKTQAHSERPPTPKQSCSIYTSLRRASIIYTRKTKTRLTMFRFIFIFFSLTIHESFSAFKWPSRRIGATCCFDRAEQIRHPESLGSDVYLCGKARINGRRPLKSRHYRIGAALQNPHLFRGGMAICGSVLRERRLTKRYTSG
jgi:hypothetical protein